MCALAQRYINDRHNEIKNNNKRVLIYCRESRDDNMENYERIETQRDLLLGYCSKKGYNNIVKVIMHDNMTGTDFQRLDEIKNMIRRGEVDTILMKDSSRLGRNQYEALGFVQFIEEYGVELEFYERKYDAELFPLEAYFHERRVRDDSEKIRATIKGKMEKGDFLVRAHYGYKKEGNKLIVDENTAWVVKKIFNLYKEGYGYRAIATMLTEEGIPTPSAYRNNPNRPQASTWIAQHVNRIINNEVYTGTMVSGKTQKVSYKSKKTKRKPESEWIRIENHHEAIIDKETFEICKRIREKKSDFAPKTKKPALLSGFMECGRCGTAMYMIRKKGRLDAFVCGKYFKEGKIKPHIEDRGCTTHRVRESDINNVIKKHIENMLENPDYRQYFNSKLKDTREKKESQSHILMKLENNLGKFKGQYEQVYNDKLDGKIPEFIFEKKSKELENNINILQKQIEEIKNRINNLDKLESNIDKIDVAMKNIRENGLSKEAVELLINKIIVYDEYEIPEEAKTLYNIDDIMFSEIYHKGGIIIDMKYNVQHVMSNRWL
ncbi:recombinase family protein [Crassaminicella indica]|uniref:Recombinase family protein n=1 Tax=Crassaminicella indica TaxID=2855394 RepID=A0ABX8R9U5_9CLOT|nr:recombinase family protein [Crassaminicella indica]QXM05819.1 recombinase family protein [Crassaminicella indica]